MINAWRTAVADFLTEQFPAVTVLSGEEDGVIREIDTIFVWWPGPWQVLQRDIALASPTLNVRYFPARSKQPTPVVPPDPGPVELAADALLGTFTRSTQEAGFFTPGLSCRLATVTPNYGPSLWRVEATLVAYALGVGA